MSATIQTQSVQVKHRPDLHISPIKIGIIGGVLEAPSAFYCKNPPVQYTDDVAFSLLEDFISNR